jgi:hypothetical protein
MSGTMKLKEITNERYYTKRHHGGLSKSPSSQIKDIKYARVVNEKLTELQ